MCLLPETQWQNKIFAFHFKWNSPFSKINKLRYYIKVQFLYIFFAYLSLFCFLICGQYQQPELNQAFSISLLTFPVGLGHWKSRNCGLYNWWCLRMLLSLLFILLSLSSPCTGLFQICVQFLFLCTGSTTGLGLKSQHSCWSFELEPYNDNSEMIIVRNSAGVSIGHLLSSKLLMIQCR